METITLKTYEIPPAHALIQTVKQMQFIERLSFDNPDFVTWVYKTFSNNCSACIPGKIWNYVQQNFKYKEDDPFDELLIAPYILKDTRQGDCDDFSLFIKTCLDILGGWFTHYIILGKEKNKFTHVAVFAHRGQVYENYVDPVYIDGTNPNFNLISDKYKYFQVI